MAEFVELQIEAGATFFSDVVVSDNNGSPKDLTGYTLAAQLRKSYYSTTATNFVLNVTNAVEGMVTMSISAANTSNIRPGRYVYDVEMTHTSSGEVTRIFEGIVTVLPNVTR